MPIYEYQCDGCGKIFEVLQKMSDAAPEKHDCGSTKLHRVMSASSFVLKGEGWYITDYGRKDKKKDKGSSGDGGSSSDKGGSSASSNGSGTPTKTAGADA